MSADLANHPKRFHDSFTGLEYELTGEIRTPRPGEDYLISFANVGTAVEGVHTAAEAIVRRPDPDPDDTVPTEDGEIHLFFGLSYASYLVLNRTQLQSMPLDWQEQFVAVLREFNERYREAPMPIYNVQVLAREPERLDTEECPDCEGEGKDVHGETCDLCDGNCVVDAEERYETPEEVGIVSDPIPHYNRGRTRVDGKGKQISRRTL